MTIDNNSSLMGHGPHWVQTLDLLHKVVGIKEKWTKTCVGKMTVLILSFQNWKGHVETNVVNNMVAYLTDEKTETRL